MNHDANRWIAGVWYDLKNHKVASSGLSVREMYLDMTTIDAMIYEKLTENKPFMVMSGDVFGNVSAIMTHDNKIIDYHWIADNYDCLADYIFPTDHRNFFEEVDAVKVPIDNVPPKTIKEEIDEPVLTEKKNSGKLDLSFLDGLRGLWTVNVVPSELGEKLGVGSYINFTNDDMHKINRDINLARASLIAHTEEMEKQLAKQKELIAELV